MILSCVLVFAIVGWWAFSVSIYNENFDKRFESYEPYMLYVNDFEGLSRSEYNFAMDCANYFAQNGYYVFAYDATGNDESEGEGVGGIPQGVIDLDHAISFVEESDHFPDLPIVLFGHSWGGYSVSSVLTYHPEVKAVIACSGCNRSSDLFEAGGKEQAGSVIYTLHTSVEFYVAQ